MRMLTEPGLTEDEGSQESSLIACHNNIRLVRSGHFLDHNIVIIVILFTGTLN